MHRIVHRLGWLFGLAAFSGCSATGFLLPNGAVQTGEQQVAYAGYEPVDPIAAPTVYTLDNATSGSRKLWGGLSPEAVRKLLPNQTSTTTIKKIAGDGSVKFLSASAAADVGVYEVVMDYAKYRVEAVYQTPSQGESSGSKEDPHLIGYGKVGIGVRITASVQTLKADVDLNGLFALGAAARAQKVKGTISVDVIGIDSAGVNTLLPVGVQLDESSIQSSLQSLASIQTKIYDNNISLTPHLMALRRRALGSSSKAGDADAISTAIIRRVEGFSSMQP